MSRQFPDNDDNFTADGTADYGVANLVSWSLNHTGYGSREDNSHQAWPGPPWRLERGLDPRAMPRTPWDKEPGAGEQAARGSVLPDEAAPTAVAGAPSSPPPDIVLSGVGPSGAVSQAIPRPIWRALVTVLVALGVLGQAWIGYQGRVTGSSSALLWYLTLCLIYTPSAILIMSRCLSDTERVWFSLYMSLALLAARFILYPSQFVYHDELINYRVLLSLIQHHHLFTPNSLLPDTADYPGMEIATAAVHDITGLPVHAAGMVILAAVRVITTLAIIRIIQRVSKSTAAGCLAALIYATNPQYIFFNSQFSYQSVALPLAFFCIYVFTIRGESRNLLSLTPTAAVILAVAASHHLTSLSLVVLLWVWYLFTKIRRRPTSQLLAAAIIGTLIVAAWTYLARAVIVPYIVEIIQNSLTNLTSLVTGQTSHQFFTDAAGTRNPPWQDALSILSVLLIIIALIPSLLLAAMKYRLLSAGAMTLFAMAAIYPMIPAGHLTNVTAEVSDRAAGFVFVGLGYIVASWWFRDAPFHRHARTSRYSVPRRNWLLVVGLTVCFVGGAVLSGPDWIYSPGRYLVSADNRSVDQLALQAAYWEGQNLPAQSRTYTDRVNGSLAAVYGNQDVLTALGNGINEGSLSNLLLNWDPQGNRVLACVAHVQYLVADQRLSTSLPHLGVYIDNGEFQYGFRTKPPPASASTQFNQVPEAELLFDNGAIRIYDLKGIACAGRN